MDTRRWLSHFTRNAELRHVFPSVPCAIPAGRLRRELSRSLAIFQLGESGGGTRLRRFVSRCVGCGEAPPDYAAAVEFFIAEEIHHAEILAAMVGHLGGTLMTKNWTNTVFRWVRSVFNLEFNIQVLLTAELIAEAYYALLRRHVPDPAIKAACAKIVGDEVAHTAFHAAFFRDRLARRLPVEAGAWALQLQLILAATRLAVWHDHRRCFAALGISRSEFHRATARACRTFLSRALPVRDAPPALDETRA
ncbi:hypothetical protein BH23VER1_BH23VER1_06170 [soil metagenome]